MAQWDIWNVIFFLTRTTYKVFWCRVLMLSLCAADSSTLFLCVWACKRLSLTASSVFEQSCACRGADHKVLRSHMPFPGLCLTSRKWQAKHNCTLCKQCMPKLYSILPTFYLQYQLCSPRISRERMRGQIKYILSWTAGANGLCHCTLCVWFLPAAKGYDTHTHTIAVSYSHIQYAKSDIRKTLLFKDKCVRDYQTTLTILAVFSELCTICNISVCIKYSLAKTCIITVKN